MSHQIQIQAIVNITPDSFYSGCRAQSREAIEARVREVIEQGCDIIDVGGYSTRPNAEEVSTDEEIRRVLEGVAILRKIAPDITISVDTFRAEVIRRIVSEFGKVIVNDISAGDFDEAMIPTAGELGLPYIAMHRRGTHADMHNQTGYRNIAEEVRDYLAAKIDTLKKAGVTDIILDPGFGFSKTIEENYELLAGLNKIVALGKPVLAGISRKSMIYKLLGTTPQESLTGTAALHWECLRQGATILRVHDVAEAKQVVKLFQSFIAAK